MDQISKIMLVTGIVNVLSGQPVLASDVKNEVDLNQNKAFSILQIAHSSLLEICEKYKPQDGKCKALQDPACIKEFENDENRKMYESEWIRSMKITRTGEDGTNVTFKLNK